MSEKNALIEFQVVGAYAKVTAVDPKTGIEATILGPASASEAMLTQAAIRKLNYVLNKQQER